jgi:hypothetical protein
VQAGAAALASAAIPHREIETRISGELLFLINAPAAESRYLFIVNAQVRSARARTGRGNADRAAVADRTALRT